MKHKINIENWIRKDHFKLFSQFEEPIYGVCINIDCTEAYKAAKERRTSVFLWYLYKALQAAQDIEEFKYRIEGDEVFLYDRIDGGSTIGRPNGTFGFGYFQYYPSFEEFIGPAAAEAESVKSSTGLTRSAAQNLIRFSALPWLDFTSISHARMYSVQDSCPRISFGKITETGSKRSMPVSIHVHHALVDGLHIGRYADRFSALMNGED